MPIIFKCDNCGKDVTVPEVHATPFGAVPSAPPDGPDIIMRYLPPSEGVPFQYMKFYKYEVACSKACAQDLAPNKKMKNIHDSYGPETFNPE